MFICCLRHDSITAEHNVGNFGEFYHLNANLQNLHGHREPVPGDHLLNHSHLDTRSTLHHSGQRLQNDFNRRSGPYWPHP
jgi:hypothetical protein